MQDDKQMRPAGRIRAHPLADLHGAGFVCKPKILANELKRAYLFARRAPNGQRRTTGAGGGAVYYMQLHFPFSPRRVLPSPLLQHNDRQAINTSEIAVAADQCGAERESRRGYPQVVFVQREAALLASELDRCVKVARPFRDRFTAQGGQELVAGLFQFRAPPACRQPGNPEEYFAANDRTRDHAITRVEPGHPALDSWARPHQIADRVCVEQVCHLDGHLSKAPSSRTGSRAAAIAASSSSTAAALG